MSDKRKKTAERYVSIPEYARILGISRIAVYTRVKKGQIPAKKIGRNYAVLLETTSSQTLQEQEVTKPHISVAELAQKLGISRIAVFQKIKNGQIQAVKCGRNYIIPTDVDLTAVKPLKSKLDKSKKLIKVVKDYVSIPELAKELGVSRIEIFNRVKAGKIRAEKIGRNYVIDRQTIRKGLTPFEQKGSDPFYLTKKFISVPELAKELGVSRVSIFYKVQKGIIKARKIGRNYVIAREDLNERGKR